MLWNDCDSCDTWLLFLIFSNLNGRLCLLQLYQLIYTGIINTNTIHVALRYFFRRLKIEANRIVCDAKQSIGRIIICKSLFIDLLMFLPVKNQGSSLGRIRPQPWLIETMSYHVKPAKRVALINIYVIGCQRVVLTETCPSPKTSPPCPPDWNTWLGLQMPPCLLPPLSPNDLVVQHHMTRTRLSCALCNPSW